MTTFDLTGELPAGVTVLEASAGTGKTYTIAGLAARYVAEGLPLERLLLVTFTRLATGELRDRVRRRLGEVAAGLEGAPSGDPVVALYRDRGADACASALANLRRALADFDAATIATTHAFCQEMLSGLGVAGDHEPEAVLVEDVSDLRGEVVDDLFVWRLADGNGAAERPSYAEAKRIAAAATAAPVALAGPPEDDERARARVRTAAFTRRVLDERKRRMAVVTYDDLVVRLRDALDTRPEAVRRLRERFQVVLVDEFQDTDPEQWDILRTAFSDRALVLIGDPKQAIYAFRGGDVHAYLDAAGTVERQVLDRNHRSDGPLVQAFDRFFAEAELGHEQIAYRPVEVEHAAPRLRGACPGALRLRFALAADMGDSSRASAPAARRHVTRDAAADIAALLGSRAEIAGDDGGWRHVVPSDVAVLVRTRWQAADIREALLDRGVPAVIAGAGSVFEQPAATEWLRLLEAVERPGHSQRAHAVALTCFWGWDAERCAAADDAEWEAVHDSLHEWAQVLRTRGVASLVETVTRERDLPARMLGRLGGERDLTDVRHLGQLLHGAALAEGLGPSALTQWLRRRVEDAETATGDEESRRLESDARAVQVLTVHRSKGLEFGVVYLPYLWDMPRIDRRPAPVVFHDGAGRRTLDVSLAGAAYQRHRELQWREQRGEDLRLLYVALTRAKHQVVLWWAATAFGRDSAMSRLLFGRRGTTVPDRLDDTVPDEAAFRALRELEARSNGTIVLEPARWPEPIPTWSGEPGQDGELAVARFGRGLDTTWRRTSYSALTAAAHEAPPGGSEPEVTATDDEPDSGTTGGLWADVPVGTRVGTVVHRALETVDFAAPEWGPEIDELGARAGLDAALATPLGEPFGIRLADVARADRVDELEFELPLGGGTLRTLADVLREHGDPYADRLATLEEAELRGFLTGFLDLVVRLPDGRFAIFDHKTNGLASFAPDALREEMHRRHYGLQALLYAVALHRYLAWRAPGAELAGVGYLFLRGMDGEPGAGVHAWTPDPALVEALSRAL